MNKEKTIRNIFMIWGALMSCMFLFACQKNIKGNASSEDYSCEKSETAEGIHYGANNYDYTGPEIQERDNLPRFYFDTEDSVLNISNDDLAFIALQSYHSSDFFEDNEFECIDFFDNPLLKRNAEIIGGFEALPFDEKIFFYVLNGNSVEKGALSHEKVDESVKKLDTITIDPYGWNSYEYENVNSYVVGENDYYVEYAVRCTYGSSTRAWRKIYYKTIVQLQDDKLNRFYYIGNQEVEDIRKTFDIYLNGRNDTEKKVLFRKIEDSERNVVYTAYYVIYEQMESGTNDKGQLYKETFFIDKGTKQISDDIELQKEVEIEGTEGFLDNPI